VREFSIWDASPSKMPHDRGFVVYSAGTPNLVVEVSALIDEISGEKLVGRLTALSFRVSDINAEYTRLVSTGTSFLSPPEKQSWGGWLAHFNDPDNNVLTLVQYAT
jgi:hypothetical protein